MNVLNNKWRIWGMALGVAGYVLIWYFANWGMAIGVFLCICGSNLEQVGAQK